MFCFPDELLVTLLTVVADVISSLFCVLSLLFFVSVGELWLERPLETAMLLSLVGVAGVVSNQWHCQLADNKHKLHACLSGKFCFFNSTS